MELRHLECFVAVVDEGSFTKAALRLHIAQPGVSAQIRRLEKEIGHSLFHRSTRSVSLTPAGETVLPHARAVLAAVGDVRRAADELKGLLRGKVQVGTVQSLFVLDLPGLLSTFHQRYPDVEIGLIEANSGDMVEAIRRGRLDVALISLVGTTAPHGLEIKVLTHDPVVAVVARDHPLAARDAITVEDLRDRELICLPHETVLRSQLDAECARVGFSPSVAFEASHPYTLARLAARGLGVAITYEAVAEVEATHLKILQISTTRLRGRLALAWSAERPLTPASRAFIDTARTWPVGSVG